MTFRKLTLILVLFGLTTLPAAAQSTLDAYFGLNALTASQAVQSIPRLGGGLFPSLGATFMLWNHLGIGGEVAWRGGRNNYFDQFGNQIPYRPLFYDFNAVIDPFSTRGVLVPEAEVGVGGESVRFYTGSYNCGFSGCTDYVSTNHLQLHLGIGLKFYLTSHIFLRPEAHLYLVHNNTEFATTAARRFGLSIGYTFGQR